MVIFFFLSYIGYRWCLGYLICRTCGINYPTIFRIFCAPEQYIYEYTESLELNKKKYYLDNIIKFSVKGWNLTKKIYHGHEEDTNADDDG